MAPKGKRSQLLKDLGGIETRGQRGRAFINLGRRNRHGPWRATVAEASADLARAQQFASKDEAASYFATLLENVHTKGNVAYDKGRYRARVCLVKGNPIQGPWRSVKREEDDVM